MSEEERYEVRLKCKAIGKDGQVQLTVSVGDESFTDTFNVASLRGREKFLDGLEEAMPELVRSEVRRELEKIAAQVVSTGTDVDGADDSDDGDGTISVQLVRLAKERYRLGRTPAGEPFAVAHEGLQLARMIRGGNRSLRAELARDYWRKYEKVANGSALTDALLVLQGEAEDADPEPVHLRLAEHEGAIVLDLGDETGRVVVVEAGRWEVRDESPVLFRRTELTGALPVPERGGSLDELRPLLNVTDETWPLVTGYMASAFLPDINHPIGLVGGFQATGKSTGAEMLARIFDPGPAILRSPPRDVEQWVLNASGSLVVVIDNVSRIPEWWSDALCRAATGDGLVRRRLYTDDQLSVISFRRVVLLTSIDPGALKGDLGDRILLIDLNPITKKDRKSETKLWKRYRSAHPRILGAFLDLLSQVLAVLPGIELEEKSRMADFNRVLAAVDQVLGTDSLGIYLGQRDRVAEDVVESDPVASAVRSFAQEVGEWSGTARALLKELTPAEPPRGWPPKGWPRNERGLGGALRRAIPALGQLGVEVVPPTDTNRGPGPRRERLFFVRLVQGETETTVQTVQPSNTGPGDAKNGDSAGTVEDDQPSNRPRDRPPETGPGSPENGGLDGRDGVDGSSRLTSEEEEVVEWTG